MNAPRSIVCGFDLSAAADDAAAVAADLADALGDELVLAHATAVDAGTPMGTVVHRAVDDEVAGLRLHGISVERVVAHEPVPALLTRVARERRARLLVIAAGGGPRSTGRRPHSGRLATALAQSTSTPLLVLHDSEVMHLWLHEERRLRVFVAVAFDDVASALRAVVAELRGVGPVDVVVGHVSFPPDEHRRLGAGPPQHLIENDPAVNALVRSELAKAWNDLPGAGTVEVRVTAGLGRTDAHLNAAAIAAEADLVVVGAHRRHGLDRVLHGAADQGLLRLSRQNVLLVPAPDGAS